MEPLDIDQINAIYLDDQMKQKRNEIWRARKELDKLKSLYRAIKEQKKALEQTRAKENQD